MSFWMKLGMEINDLAVFKNSCKEHDVEYQENKDPNFSFHGAPVEATLRIKGSRNNGAYLTREGGGFKMHMDNNTNYSDFSRTVGRNGGKLTRDYSVGVIKKQVGASGGMINSALEQPDGSILLRVATM